MIPAPLVSRVIFPLQERLKGKRTSRRLAELERTQWLPADRLAELQFRRLQSHVDFVYREVPYYTHLLDDHELPPRRIQSPADFARIPFLTKDIIRERLDDLRPRSFKGRAQWMSTGGSTGAPVTVLVDMERQAFTDAARRRAHRWFSVDVGVPEIVLWGSPLEVGKQDRVRAVRDWLMNSRLISAFDLGEASLARHAEAVRRQRPLKLYGYASALYLLARYLERTGWRAAPGWPRVVFTTAEPLYDFQRVVIERVFGCPAAVEYGCRDAGLVANECPEGRLHVAAEGMVVEANPLEGTSGAAASRGELVLTNLDSFAMPIIRYRTGDIGALAAGACDCGRGLPLLGAVEGRRTDFLVTPSGRLMHALAVIYVVREAPGIREFQVVQETVAQVSIRVVAGEAFTPSAGEVLIGRLERLFEGAITVTLERVDEIARPASGKHRHVISHVADRHVEQLMEVR